MHLKSRHRLSVHLKIDTEGTFPDFHSADLSLKCDTTKSVVDLPSTTPKQPGMTQN